MADLRPRRMTARRSGSSSRRSALLVTTGSGGRARRSIAAMNPTACCGSHRWAHRSSTRSPTTRRCCSPMSRRARTTCTFRRRHVRPVKALWSEPMRVRLEGTRRSRHHAHQGPRARNIGMQPGSTRIKARTGESPKDKTRSSAFEWRDIALGTAKRKAIVKRSIRLQIKNIWTCAFDVGLDMDHLGVHGLMYLRCHISATNGRQGSRIELGLSGCAVMLELD